MLVRNTGIPNILFLCRSPEKDQKTGLDKGNLKGGPKIPFTSSPYCLASKSHREATGKRLHSYR